MNRLSLTAIAATSMVLSSCSMLSWKYLPWNLVSQQQSGSTTTPTGKNITPKNGAATTSAATGEAGAAATAVTPTPEQQAAAAAVTGAATGATPAAEATAGGDTTTYTAPEETGSDVTTYTTPTTTTIPGRTGLRMGRFAPPEEAASAGESAAPAPNAAEQRGLRSPKLPRQLPLNIDGQTKPAEQ